MNNYFQWFCDTIMSMMLYFSAVFIGVGGINNPADIHLVKLTDSSVYRGETRKESKIFLYLLLLRSNSESTFKVAFKLRDIIRYSEFNSVCGSATADQFWVHLWWLITVGSTISQELNAGCWVPCVTGECPLRLLMMNKRVIDTCFRLKCLKLRCHDFSAFAD